MNKHRRRLTLALTLLLPLSALAFVEPPPTMESALSALSSGDPRPAEELLSTLSNRQKRAFEHRLLAAQVALTHMDVETAHKELSAIKEREITDSLTYRRIADQINTAERMLGAMQSIRLLDSLQLGQTDDLLQRQRRDFGALGQTDRSNYIAKGGQVRWTVLPNEEGGTTFGLVTLLGDGSWDEANIQRIEIKGLDPTGQVSSPFLMPDGRTLYFSYSGPGTLGGSDIYVSRYDAANHSLLVPQQLPLPINSFADDYGYILDEDTGIASFITEQHSPAGMGKYVVYRRTQGDSATEFLDSVPVQPAERPIADLLSVQREAATPTTTEKAPLFYIASKPVRSEADLTSSSARAVLGRYLRMHDAHQKLLQRLRQLRQSSTPRSMEAEILALEEQEMVYHKELNALRNEVIKQELNL